MIVGLHAVDYLLLVPKSVPHLTSSILYVEEDDDITFPASILVTLYVPDSIPPGKCHFLHIPVPVLDLHHTPSSSRYIKIYVSYPLPFVLLVSMLLCADTLYLYFFTKNIGQEHFKDMTGLRSLVPEESTAFQVRNKRHLPYALHDFRSHCHNHYFSYTSITCFCFISDKKMDVCVSGRCRSLTILGCFYREGKWMVFSLQLKVMKADK